MAQTYQYVTKEAFQTMITLQKGYIDAKLNEKQKAFTVGAGLSLENDVLSVTLDTNLFKVVTSLPEAPAASDANKIHLVLTAGGQTGNTYTEYIYLGAEKGWEKLGEFKAEVDLTPYLKTNELVATLTNGGYSLSKAGIKFMEVAYAASDFTGLAADGKLSLSLKSVITAAASGFYKFQVDAKGRVVAVTAVKDTDITALGFSTTASMSSAITSAVETEKTARETAVKKVADDLAAETKNRTDNDANLASGIQTLNTKVAALEEIENNHSNLTVEETTQLFNSIYGA